MNFPNNPAINDTYSLGSRTWVWNGTAWLRVVQPVIVLDASTIVSGTINSTVLTNSGALLSSNNLSDLASASLARSNLGLGLLINEATNTLAQRNGTNAQSLRVYNTFTDALNHERGGFTWSGNFFRVEAIAAGTGTRRPMVLTASEVIFNTGTTETTRWRFNSSGHLTAEADNTYDIGQSGATRPRHGYFGGSLVAGYGTFAGGTVTANAPVIDITQTWNNASIAFTALRVNVTDTASQSGLSGTNLIDLQVGGASRFRIAKDGGVWVQSTITIPAGSSVQWSGRGDIFAAANGVIGMRNATATDFDRLWFGGSTNLFPALKRSSATLQARLADDSNFASFTALSFAATGGTVTASAALLDLTQTWNNVAVVFNGLNLNITDTASSATSTLLQLQVGGVNRFYFRKDGQLYASTGFLTETGASLSWATRSNIISPADGQLALRNNAGTDFGLLQFGGTTSSFVALKRNGAGLDIRLADDSAYSFITVSQIELGAASDTTITRTAAGIVAVEGKNLAFEAVQPSTETSGTLTVASANKIVNCTGDITLNNSVMAAETMVLFDAGASNRTITAGAGVTMYLRGTSVATATLNAQRTGGARYRTASVIQLEGGFA